MQENIEMRWLINAFDRKRIHDERMECSKLAMKALIARTPHDQPIDLDRLVKESLTIGKALVVGFVEEKLI